MGSNLRSKHFAVLYIQIMFSNIGSCVEIGIDFSHSHYVASVMGELTDHIALVDRYTAWAQPQCLEK